MSLTTVDAFRVPRKIVAKTERSLRSAGDRGFELFVLWCGHQDGSEFRVRSLHVPRQRSLKTESGLLVRVEGPALHSLNKWLYEHGQVLAAQIHAHPTEAFHSETDDDFPIVTQRGGLSIVLADFARSGLTSDATAVFRLDESRWAPVENPFNGLLRVEP